MYLPKSLALVGLVSLCSALHAQTCDLVFDANRTPSALSSNASGSWSGPGGQQAVGLVRCGSYWYFAAQTLNEGRELWRTDGTPGGTVLVKDIAPGAGGSSPSQLHCVRQSGRQILFFRATTTTSGNELWKSDGTAAGTVLVKDINAGPANSSPADLQSFGGKVYFRATTAANGAELWSSDGTSAGTVLVKDIRAGSQNSSPFYLLTNSAGNGVYFRCNDGATGTELWKSDGTSAGTVQVKDIRPGSSSSFPWYMVNFGGKTIFRANDGTTGTELWITDGSAAGTVQLKDIRAGGSSSSPNIAYPAVLGNFLYFAANNGTNGSELWRTDGTSAGTTLAADIRAGSSSSSPGHLTTFNGAIYMRANDGTSGNELWKFDGTTASLVKDIYAGSTSGNPWRFRVFGSRLFMYASDAATGREAWISDGTSAGTTMLADINVGTGSSSPGWPQVVASNKLIFVGTDGNIASGAVGNEWRETDGTTAGTKLFKDIAMGSTTPSSGVDVTTCAWGNTVFFEANDSTNGNELWKHDSSGTSLVRDLSPGTASSTISAMMPCGDKVYFVVRTSATGTELGVTDGTSAGTKIYDIRSGTSSSSPTGLTCFEGKLYFRAFDAATGSELYVADPVADTVAVFKDIRPGTSSSLPAWINVLNGKLIFTANDGTNGTELWCSDGTSAGTTMITDLSAGSNSSSPNNLVPVMLPSGARIAFSAFVPATGRELYITDGTSAGTSLVKDVRAGSSSSSPGWIRTLGNKLVFAANDGTNGTELHISDGTSAGTQLLKNINAGSSSSSPTNLTVCGSTLFFGAFDSTNGRELWKSDGSAAGTVLVRDIRSGSSSSSPSNLTCFGKTVYFSANDGSRGTELWKSDGTSAGTTIVCDLYAGTTSSTPSDFAICCGDLYFSGFSFLYGRELFRVSMPGASVERLGGGCDGATMHASAPILGQTMTLSGLNAPAAHVGVVLYAPPAARPSTNPALSSGCVSWLGAPFFIWQNVATSSWTSAVPIPNDASLKGVKVTWQTWYVNLSTITPIKTTNGVLTTLGN